MVAVLEPILIFLIMNSASAHFVRRDRLIKSLRLRKFLLVRYAATISISEKTLSGKIGLR